MIIVLRIALSGVTLLALTFLVGAFLAPSGPGTGTVSPEKLADPDSLFVTVDTLRVHYKAVGAGEPAVILLHGFGAGEFTWQEVLEPLSEYGTVVAFDRPGFGLTQRPLPGQWTGRNPYSAEFQEELLVGLMDALGLESAVLVGNSAGGNVAAHAALSYPSRVDALILVDAAIYGHGATEEIVGRVLSTPVMQHVGPLIARIAAVLGTEFADSSWHDPSKLTPEIRADYQKQLQADNWDFGFWEAGRVGLPTDLGSRLDEIDLPVLVITGDDDSVVPTEDSVRLAGEIPNAELAVIPDCGHVPNEECPEEFLHTALDFLGGLASAS